MSQNANGIGEHHYGTVGNPRELGNACHGRCSGKLIDSLNHITHVTVEGRDSLDSSVLVQSEGGGEAGRVDSGIATVEGVINLGVTSAAGDIHLDGIIIGTCCRLD